MANLTVSPSSGPVGTSIVISGSGFPKRSLMRLLFDDVVIGNLRIKNNGTFALTYILPSSITVGIHKIIATINGIVFGNKTFEVTSAVIQPPPPSPPSGSGIYWGARIDGAFYQEHYGGNSNDAPWAAGDSYPNNWDRFEAHASKKVSAIHWGGSGTAIIPFDANASYLTRSRGAFSNYSMGASVQDMIDLAEGSDVNGAITRITNWAHAVHVDNRPIMLRLWWEMNGNWGYPWQSNSTSRANFIAAWRRVHDIITSICSNVSFFWCPNVILGNEVLNDWYPGDAYVDWVGFDGYCHENESATKTPSWLFDATYNYMQTHYPTKPIAIGETGCSAVQSGIISKAAWITDFLETWLPAHTAVKYFSWFNEASNPIDPHIEIGPGTLLDSDALNAFKHGISSSYYLQNIVDSATFPQGAKIPIPT